MAHNRDLSKQMCESLHITQPGTEHMDYDSGFISKSQHSVVKQVVSPNASLLTSEEQRKLHNYNIYWFIARDQDGDNEIMNVAADRDNEKVVTATINCENPEHLLIRNFYGQTILHIASIFCNAQIVRFLLTRGADATIQDAYGYTALHHAVERGDQQVVEALTRTPETTEAVHPFYEVPRREPPSVCAGLYNYNGDAPIHMAAKQGNTEIIRILCKLPQVSIDDTRLTDGFCAAHIAVASDNYELLKFCLELGADSEVRNASSYTPQQLAYKLGKHEMVELCQSYSADPRQLEKVECEDNEYIFGESILLDDRGITSEQHYIYHRMEQASD